MSQTQVSQTQVSQTQESKTQTGHGILFDRYLSKGELYAPLVCTSIFPYMSAQEINESLDDVVTFIEEYVALATQNHVEKVGELFFTDILHAYGHIITFIKNARVDMTTKNGFTVEEREWVPNAVPLADDWLFSEEEEGSKLYVDQLYAAYIYD